MPTYSMIVFSNFPEDPRVRREAEAFAEAGFEVDVICLKKSCLKENNAELPYNNPSIKVYRLPVRRSRGQKSRYLFEYAVFIFLSFFVVAYLHLRRHYQVIHVHNMPDVLVFSALIPRLFGAKVVLDLHDPMPEVFMTKYALKASHVLVRLLLFLEKMSIAFAHLVITPNIAFRDIFASRSCSAEKIHLVMNSPQEDIFLANGAPPPPSPDEGTGKKNFVIMFHGTIVERHGLDNALQAIAGLTDRIPNLRFEVYGTGDFVGPFLEMVEELNLQQVVFYHGPVALETIAKAIPNTDIGLVPNKRSPFTEINMPTRIFEYLCLQRPVIVPNTKGIRDYFQADSLFFFEPGDIEDLKRVILEVYNNPSKRDEILKKGMAIYSLHRWESEKRYLVRVVKDLLKMA